MIIAQLKGGLGNQMFQYAFGRSLAAHRNQELLLYVDGIAVRRLDSEAQRSYGLDYFNLAGEVVNTQSLLVKSPPLVWTLTEIGFGFYPEVFRDSDPHAHIGIMGWWQSERYFHDIADVIHHDFSFVSDYVCPHPKSLLEKITNSNSVCVHVRRTDYLRDEDIVGFIGLDYYEKAIGQLSESLDAPQFFVFSDDIDWCEANLKPRAPVVYVRSSFPQPHAAHDLYAMTQCKHFIIANSSYSWWAAWLAEARDKVVIAPRLWFRNERQARPSIFTSKDLIPAKWITL